MIACANKECGYKRAVVEASETDEAGGPAPAPATEHVSAAAPAL